jgi:hypothetical protein
MRNFKISLFIAVTVIVAACKTPVPAPTPTPTEDASLKIGWVGNEAGSYVGNGTTSPTKFSAAIQVPDSMIVDKGTEIIAVRMMIDAPNTTSAEIFIAESLRGEPLYTQNFNLKHLGWEYVKLNTPFKISSRNDNLVIGYNINATGYPVGYAGLKKKSDMADNVAINNNWQHLTSSLGAFVGVSIQAFVAGGDYSAQKQYDLQISNVKFEPYLPLGAENKIKGLVTNYGVKTIKDGFSVAYTDNKGDTQNVAVNLPLANGETAEFELPNITASAYSEVEFTLTATPKNASNSTSNNTFKGEQMFYGSNYVERTLLFEEFTSQYCNACPYGAEDIHAMTAGKESRVAVVAHHVGYKDDNFTLSDCSPFEWFYNDGGVVYAPAMMCDRRIIDGNTSMNRGNPSPVFSPNASTTFTTRQLQVPAFVSVNLSTNYTAATRELTVDVSGEFVYDYPNAKLNVFLVQDGIKARQASYNSSGAGITINDYVHNNVMRAFISTASWGDDIPNTAGATYSKQYSYTIPANIQGFTCVPENMRVVAFVADRKSGSSNIDKNEVRNAAFKKIIE